MVLGAAVVVESARRVGSRVGAAVKFVGGKGSVGSLTEVVF